MISKQVIKASKRNNNLILLSFDIHLFLQINSMTTIEYTIDT